jgi:hypothetical protein
MALSTDFTYTWAVNSLKKKDEVNSEGVTLEGAIVQTHWKLTGTDANGNSAIFSGATPFTAANVPAGSFTAFADLTEASVISWIQAVVNADQSYADHIVSRIQHEIDEKTITDAPMPWAPEAEVVTPLPEDMPE